MNWKSFWEINRISPIDTPLLNYSTWTVEKKNSQEDDIFPDRFQYVLAAATSIATKVNEETLTYLNQGQSYEIKLKKVGDLSNFRGKIMKVMT